METAVLKRTFTVDEFRRMAEAGIFGEGDRLELLDGEIVRMTPIGRRHAGCVDRLADMFWERCRATAIVRIQNPVWLSGQTELYPDVALLKRRSDFYSESLPRPADVLLVVEVSDTTGEYDRGVKLPRYAGSGIPEVWVVDLPESAVDIYRQPAGGEYREHQRLSAGQTVAIPGVFGQQIRVDDMLV